MWIKDLRRGKVFRYGNDRHDALRISDDGRTLSYENLQNGDGSRWGDYRFVTNIHGHIPLEDETLMEYGADAYFDIGGKQVNDYSKQEVVGEIITTLPNDDKENIKQLFCDCYCQFPEEYLGMYKDPDVAWDNLDREKCSMCPLEKL